MAPNQPLIVFFCILLEHGYEVENMTFCNRLQPDPEQVLLAICSRFENLESRRKRGGGRKNAGHAFENGAGGILGGKALFLVRRTRLWEGTRGSW